VSSKAPASNRCATNDALCEKSHKSAHTDVEQTAALRVSISTELSIDHDVRKRSALILSRNLMTDKPTEEITEGTVPLKDGESSFGSFYPKNYVLAVFKTDAEATHAGEALSATGFAGEDVIVATGADVVEHNEAVRSQQGIMAKLGEKLSRLYTDEAANADALMEFAGQGAAFVLAYAPDEETTERATEVLRAFTPPIFRKYDSLKITELGAA